MGQGEEGPRGAGARGREEGFFQAVGAEARVEARVLCLQAPDCVDD